MVAEKIQIFHVMQLNNITYYEDMESYNVYFGMS